MSSEFDLQTILDISKGNDVLNTFLDALFNADSYTQIILAINSLVIFIKIN